MTFSRPGCLRTIAACLFICGVAYSQEQQPPQPQQPPPAKPQPPQQKKANPFETIPQTTDQPQPPKPQPPKLETPKPAEEAKPNLNPEDVIESIEFRGARRVPQDTLRALIFSKKGDNYD